MHRGSIERVLAENPFSLNVIFEELMIALEGEAGDDELCTLDEHGFVVGWLLKGGGREIAFSGTDRPVSSPV